MEKYMKKNVHMCKMESLPPLVYRKLSGLHELMLEKSFAQSWDMVGSPERVHHCSHLQSGIQTPAPHCPVVVCTMTC